MDENHVSRPGETAYDDHGCHGGELDAVGYDEVEPSWNDVVGEVDVDGAANHKSGTVGHRGRRQYDAREEHPSGDVREQHTERFRRQLKGPVVGPRRSGEARGDLTDRVADHKRGDKDEDWTPEESRGPTTDQSRVESRRDTVRYGEDSL